MGWMSLFRDRIPKEEIYIYLAEKESVLMMMVRRGQFCICVYKTSFEMRDHFPQSSLVASIESDTQSV